MARVTDIKTRSDDLHTVVITIKDLPNGDVQCTANPSMTEVATRAQHGYTPTMAEAYAMRMLRVAIELNREISQNKGRPIIFGTPPKSKDN
jgi:uncharacterized protein YoxC